jgi:CubicO group peptidase (beta-lactamase class C family)
VTLRNLLQAPSGVEVNQVRGLNFYADQSRAREFFTMPIVHEPGTYYEYDQTATSVTSYVVQRAIWRHEPGLDFQDYAQRELFNQLGIPKSAYFWQRDRAGTTTAYSQLFLRPLETGRLGELIRTGGVYDHRRIISERYLREFRTAAKTNCSYGFLTFLNSCTPGQKQVDVSVPTRRDPGGVPWVASALADMIFTDGIGIRTFVIPSLDPWTRQPAPTSRSVPELRRAATPWAARANPTRGFSGMSVMFCAPSLASWARIPDPMAADGRKTAADDPSDGRYPMP